MKYLLAFGLLTLGGCTMASVGPGHQGVLVEQPWLFGHGGVAEDPVKPGMTLAAITTSVIDVNMLPVTFDEEFKDIMPKDNNPVDYHAAVRLRVTDAVLLINKFGQDWYKNNIQRPFQTMNRNQVRQYSMPDLALQQDLVIKVEGELRKELSDYIKRIGVPVEVQDVTLGRISPQQEIINAYNATGVQQQRAKTEVQRANAEIARKQAEIQRGLADRAYQDSLGLTSQQFIQLQQIKMCSEKQNCSVFLGSTPIPVVGKD